MNSAINVKEITLYEDNITYLKEGSKPGLFDIDKEKKSMVIVSIEFMSPRGYIKAYTDLSMLVDSRIKEFGREDIENYIENLICGISETKLDEIASATTLGVGLMNKEISIKVNGINIGASKLHLAYCVKNNIVYIICQSRKIGKSNDVNYVTREMESGISAIPLKCFRNAIYKPEFRDNKELNIDTVTEAVASLTSNFNNGNRSKFQPTAKYQNLLKVVLWKMATLIEENHEYETRELFNKCVECLSDKMIASRDIFKEMEVDIPSDKIEYIMARYDIFNNAINIDEYIGECSIDSYTNLVWQILESYYNNICKLIYNSILNLIKE